MNRNDAPFLRLSGSAPRYSARNGVVLDSGHEIRRPLALELLAMWRREARKSDYFTDTAKAYARELETALREAGIIREDKAA